DHRKFRIGRVRCREQMPARYHEPENLRACEQRRSRKQGKRYRQIFCAGIDYSRFHTNRLSLLGDIIRADPCSAAPQPTAQPKPIQGPKQGSVTAIMSPRTFGQIYERVVIRDGRIPANIQLPLNDLTYRAMRREKPPM